MNQVGGRGSDAHCLNAAARSWGARCRPEPSRRCDCAAISQARQTPVGQHRSPAKTPATGALGPACSGEDEIEPPSPPTVQITGRNASRGVDYAPVDAAPGAYSSAPRPSQGAVGQGGSTRKAATGAQPRLAQVPIPDPFARIDRRTPPPPPPTRRSLTS